MKQRTSLILAAVVTGFLLVAVGGVAGRVANASAASPDAAAVSTDLVSAMQQREAAYRQMIAEANSRLAQAQPASADVAISSYPVTADQAMVIAALSIGGRPVRLPELVDVQGIAAYEVVLTTGTFYVDATTGRILGGTIPPSNAIARASGGEHEEHEGDSDD